MPQILKLSSEYVPTVLQESFSGPKRKLFTEHPPYMLYKHTKKKNSSRGIISLHIIFALKDNVEEMVPVHSHSHTHI